MDFGTFILLGLPVSVLLNLVMLCYIACARGHHATENDRIKVSTETDKPSRPLDAERPEYKSELRKRLPGNDTIVIFCKSGRVYHHPGCKHVQVSQSKDDRSEVKSYSPCKDCFK